MINFLTDKADFGGWAYKYYTSDLERLSCPIPTLENVAVL